VDLARARRLATDLLAEHGLLDWELGFDSAKTRAGVCRPAVRRITLSRHLTALHDEAEVRETVLHEIAHALVGVGHGHDAVWRAAARRIGASGSRCVAADAPRVEGDWVGRCPAGHRVTAHRRPRRVKSCRRCSATFDPGSVFVWTYRGRPAAMHPGYAAELEGLRRRAFAATTAPALAGRLQPGQVQLPLVPSPSPEAPRSPAVGDRVRLRGGGRYGGLLGVVEGRGRTRFRVRTESGLVTAPFAMVDVVGSAGSRR
jgi:predicted SprT family Zn-dependent metalloprotease